MSATALTNSNLDTIEGFKHLRSFHVFQPGKILFAAKKGLYPSWDAQNIHSVHLAKKLGYEFDHAYTAYEVAAEARTHSRFE